jgi:hypothetical protein
VHVETGADIDPMGRTPDLGLAVDLASQSKNEFNLESFGLTEDKDDSTSSFHALKVLSRDCAVASKVASHASHYWSATSISSRHEL